jgi:hypothetical protein
VTRDLASDVSSVGLEMLAKMAFGRKRNTFMMRLQKL